LSANGAAAAGADGAADRSAAGALFAVSAYGLWGITPIYFKWLTHVGAVEIVVHRVLWSALLLAVLIWATGAGPRLRAVVTDRRKLVWLLASSAVIGLNWLVFIYAVVAERVLEASLGYFINPLVTLVLGMLFLRERLRPAQWLAVGLALLGVGNEVVRFGDVPWLALILAFSFGFYGLVRKRIAVDAFTGLTVETWLLLPLAAGWLVWAAGAGDGVTAGHVLRPPSEVALLFLTGPITMIPLLCFAAAAARLALGTLGFFQYIAPSLQLLLAVQMFGEPFHPAQWLTFLPIWAGLVLFSGHALHEHRRQRMAHLPAGPEPLSPR
jgi:chloramphenicol-sensitive protein RarD